MSNKDIEKELTLEQAIEEIQKVKDFEWEGIWK